MSDQGALGPLYGGIDESYSIGLRLIASVDSFLGGLDQAEGAVGGWAGKLQSAFRVLSVDVVGQERVVEDTLNGLSGFLNRSTFKVGAWATAITGSFQLAASAANKYQRDISLITQVSENLGIGSTKVFDTITKNTKGIATEADVALGSLKLLGTSLSPDQMDKFIGRVREAATAMGLGGEEIGNQARALRQWNVNILDNIGVNIRLDKLLHEQARILGKAESAITGAETEQAIYNEVIKQTNKYIGVENKLIAEGRFAYVQFQANIRKIVNIIGQYALPAYTALGKILEKVSSAFKKALDSQVTRTIIKMWQKIGDVISSITKIFLGLDIHGDDIIELFAKLIVTLGALVAPPLIAGIVALSVALTALSAAFSTLITLITFGFTGQLLKGTFLPIIKIFKGDIKDGTQLMYAFKKAFVIDDMMFSGFFKSITIGIKDLRSGVKPAVVLLETMGRVAQAATSAIRDAIKWNLQSFKETANIAKAIAFGPGEETRGNIQHFMTGFKSKAANITMPEKFGDLPAMAKSALESGKEYGGTFLKGFLDLIVKSGNKIGASFRKAFGPGKEATKVVGAATAETAAVEAVKAASGAGKALGAAGLAGNLRKITPQYGTLLTMITNVGKATYTWITSLKFVGSSIAQLGGILGKVLVPLGTMFGFLIRILSPLAQILWVVQLSIIAYKNLIKPVIEWVQFTSRQSTELKKLDERIAQTVTGLDKYGKAVRGASKDTAEFFDLINSETDRQKRLEELNKEFGTTGSMLKKLIDTLYAIPIAKDLGNWFNRLFGWEERKPPQWHKAVMQLETETTEQVANILDKKRTLAEGFANLFTEEGLVSFNNQGVYQQIDAITDMIKYLGTDGLAILNNLDTAAYAGLQEGTRKGSEAAIAKLGVDGPKYALFLYDMLSDTMAKAATQGSMIPTTSIVNAEQAEAAFKRIEDAGIRTTQEQIDVANKLVSAAVRRNEVLGQSVMKAEEEYANAKLTRGEMPADDPATIRVQKLRAEYSKATDDVRRFSSITKSVNDRFLGQLVKDEQEFITHQTSMAVQASSDKNTQQVAHFKAMHESFERQLGTLDAQLMNMRKNGIAGIDTLRDSALALEQSSTDALSSIRDFGVQLRNQFLESRLEILRLHDTIKELLDKSKFGDVPLNRQLDYIVNKESQLAEIRDAISKSKSEDERIQNLAKEAALLREMYESASAIIDQTKTPKTNAERTAHARALQMQSVLRTQLEDAEARYTALGGQVQSRIDGLIADASRLEQGINAKVTSMRNIAVDAAELIKSKVAELGPLVKAIGYDIWAMAENAVRLGVDPKTINQAIELLQTLNDVQHEISATAITNQGAGLPDYSKQELSGMTSRLRGVGGIITSPEDKKTFEDALDTFSKSLVEAADREESLLDDEANMLGKAMKPTDRQYQAVRAGDQIRLEGQLNIIRGLLLKYSSLTVKPKPAYAHGGEVSGQSGIDRVDIKATAGEYIINKDSTRRFKPLLEALNKFGNTGNDQIKRDLVMGLLGGIQGYATGGQVQGNTSRSTNLEGVLVTLTDSINNLVASMNLMDRSSGKKGDVERMPNIPQGMAPDLKSTVDTLQQIKEESKGLSSTEIGDRQVSLSQLQDLVIGLDEKLKRLAVESITGVGNAAKNAGDEVNRFASDISYNAETVLLLSRATGENKDQLYKLRDVLDVAANAATNLGDNSEVTKQQIGRVRTELEKEIAAYQASTNKAKVLSDSLTSTDIADKLRKGVLVGPTLAKSEFDSAEADFKAAYEAATKAGANVNVGEVMREPGQRLIDGLRTSITAASEGLSREGLVDQLITGKLGGQFRISMENLIAKVGPESPTGVQLRIAMTEMFTGAFANVDQQVQDHATNIKDLAIGVSQAFGEGIVAGFKGTDKALKDVFKKILLLMLDFIEKELVIAKLGAMVNAIRTSGWSALKDFPGILLASAALAAAKSAISQFAEGGIVTRPTNAIIGENNKPEAVIPLYKLPGILEKMNIGGQRQPAQISIQYNPQFNEVPSDARTFARESISEIERLLKDRNYVSVEARRLKLGNA